MIDGTTLNLGRLGALVATARDYDASDLVPQPGDTVQLEIALPVHRNFGQRCLACDAVAVRATNGGTGFLVALQFERVEIRSLFAESAAAGRMGVM